MNAIGTFGIGRAQGDYALQIRVLRGAKHYYFQRFHGERETAPARECDVRENTDAEDASCFETDAPRFSRAPRLNSAFAAQVLGQILMKSEYQAPSAAYRQPPRRLARNCDLSV